MGGQNLKFEEFFSEQSSESEFLSACLCCFSVTTLTNDHELCGLKQYKFIIFQFGSSKVQNDLIAYYKGVSRALFLLEALGENLFPCLSQHLESVLLLWLMAPSLNYSFCSHLS